MSEVRLPAPVKATPVADITDPASPAGAFKYWRDGERIGGMNFRCPCGCGHLSVLYFRPLDPGDEGPSWEWDGNVGTPTLTPSVHRVGHWHGFLKAGFWTQT